MTAPHAGVMCFHDSRAIELLWLVKRDKDGETWRVRPLFVTGPERDEFIARGTMLRPIHGTRVYRVA